MMAKTLPGVVVSYDATSKTCSVQPAVHLLVPTEADPDEDYVEELPVLLDVPVAWPRAQGYSLVGSLSPGDSVLLVACDRDISGWRRSGKASEPDTAQVHSWSSAIAIPGLQPDSGGFATPSDKAALASDLDKLIGILKGWSPVTSDGGAALKAAINVAFPNYSSNPAPVPSTATTVGSSKLRLDP